MARLVHGYVPGHWRDTDGGSANGCIQVNEEGRPYLSQSAHQCADQRQHLEREQASLDNLDQDRLWKTPAGDSYAFYYIVSEKPLQLVHLPVGDGYQARPETIRGLRLADVRRDIQWQNHVRNLFREKEDAAGGR